jgi:methyl-accepting chemotaxis protein
MNRFKIGTRISAGFTAVILIAAALGIFAYLGLGNVQKHAVGITSDSLPGVYVVGQIQSLQARKMVLLLQHAEATDPAEMLRLETAIDGLTRQLGGLFGDYEKTIFTQKDRDLFTALTAARSAFVASAAEFVTTSRASKEQALAMVGARLDPAFQKFSDATAAEVTFNKENGDASAKEISSSVSFAKTGVLISLFLTVIAGGLIALFIARSIATPLSMSVANLDAISRGDLSKDASAEFQARGDEIGALSRSMQTMTVALRKMILEISSGITVMSSSSSELIANSAGMKSGSQQASDKANSVAAAAEEMSSNITSVAAGMEQTTTNLSHVSTATEQMTSTIGEIAQNSEKARRITEEATRQAACITDQISQLGAAAQEIGKVTEDITEISSQTNLLALNATIEAARAGSAGKGFAVVATEIKALAQQTAKATEDIKARIAGVQTATAGGITEIEKISKVILDVSAIVASIAAAIEQQATATKDIARNIAEASAGMTDANSRVSETSHVSHEIAKDIVSVDRSSKEMATGSDRVHLSAGKLSTVADALRVSVSRFKIGTLAGAA